jgi:hypothetical protein
MVAERQVGNSLVLTFSSVDGRPNAALLPHWATCRPARTCVMVALPGTAEMPGLLAPDYRNSTPARCNARRRFGPSRSRAGEAANGASPWLTRSRWPTPTTRLRPVRSPRSRGQMPTTAMAPSSGARLKLCARDLAPISRAQHEAVSPVDDAEVLGQDVIGTAPQRSGFSRCFLAKDQGCRTPDPTIPRALIRTIEHSHATSATARMAR